MDKLIVKGPSRLIGEVSVSGAKNSVLALMASALLTGESKFTNVPLLKDISTFTTLLSHMGCGVKVDETNKSLTITTPDKINAEAPYEMVKTMRASIMVLGPLVARFKKARVSLPGGCAIGARPVNLHLSGLEKMGAKVEIDHGYVIVSSDRLKGAKIYLEYPTVTGTANLMMAAVLAEGTTILENAAQEPELVELETVLNKMGATVSGAGTDKITIIGVESLNPISHSVMPDRIEAGTFMIASAMTEGNVLIKDCKLEHLNALTVKLIESGTEITEEEDGVRVIGHYPYKSVDIKTHPYPGFPTDMQAQMMAMMTLGSGLSVITELVFENRFMHVSELDRMGADITIDGRNAIVKGVTRLSGAPVMATDLRASASLVLAGLVAEGTTEISRIYHLDRGYEKIEDKLKALGADITRVKESK